MSETTCPKCKAVRTKDAAYCVCGYRWGDEGVREVLRAIFSPKEKQ